MLLPYWGVLLILAVAVADKRNSLSLSSEFGVDAVKNNCADEGYLCELKSAGW